LQSTRAGQFKFADPAGFRQALLDPFVEALGGDWTEVDNETVAGAETRQLFSGMAGPRLVSFVASGAAGRYGFYRKAATGATLTVIRLGGNVPARNSAVRAALGYRRDLTETTSALYGAPDIRTWTSDKTVVLLRTSAGDSTLTLVVASDVAAAKEAEVAMMR
jgi:hypothetical protein